GSAGSNGLIQAKEFSKSTPLTGMCVSKLDGSYKGGIVVAIHGEFKFPVRYVGLGEGPDDLEEFDPQTFAAALFPDDSV
ncbi:MAG: signal recognition particle-docking protein FtsY, partial [Lentisphaeria bacterium]|nr:signal recognition particle-docking protein FtsY [Lentisphaeria bacterium]